MDRAEGVWVRYDGAYIISDESGTLWVIVETYDGDFYYSGSGDNMADALRNCARHFDTQSPDTL